MSTDLKYSQISKEDIKPRQKVDKITIVAYGGISLFALFLRYGKNLVPSLYVIKEKKPLKQKKAPIFTKPEVNLKILSPDITL